ncbi:1-acyl-sn-glycerol-3-phosphate acyltransferase [Portibacter marinus]|uniref:1-acyl-sn-glycerol-3-phosphate acyltransferase n=1 Tax=Portibacter marinus TaxID=2898660 RepID=UPI001F27E1A1|nr:1-acyl-sn-glycerol-3-phosphate acyltransferase [Portibacter marinus]
MIKKYSFDIFKPKWPKWKVKVADFFLNALPLGVAAANKMIRKYGHLKNHQFIDRVIEDRGHKLDIVGLEHIPLEGPVTLVSNHPGGADVVATISAIGKRRPDFVILANELICVEPVVDIVLPVNTMAKDNKVNFDAVHQAYRDGKVVVFYAAGKNSRYNDEGLLRDRKWRPTFLDFAIQYRTPITILRIGGSNAKIFYKVSRLREKYERFKKVPLENIFQLRELVNPKDEAIQLTFSESIPAEEVATRLQSGELSDKRALADALYQFLYAMSEENLKFQG